MALALLGAITHQAVAVGRQQVVRGARGKGFAARYAGVPARPFVRAVLVLYPATMLLGGLIYPTYRLDVRPAFEDMDMAWAVGLFELKEHWAAVGLLALPFYAERWRRAEQDGQGIDWPCRLITWALAGVVWFDLVAGHLLNDLRGL